MRIKMRERKRGMAEKKREKSVDVLDRLFLEHVCKGNAEGRIL